MGTKEVTIGPQIIKKEKFSEDVRRDARRYLSARGFNPEELTDKQFEYVAKYIKAKRYTKFAIFMSVVATVASVFSAYTSYISVKKSADRLAEMIPSETVIIRADNSRTVIEADPKVIYFYGKANVLMGFAIGFFGFVTVYSTTQVVIFILKVRRKDPAIEVFLPVKQPVSTTN